ncbi:MAG TPA: tRNA guanosine(34) transglycosylase Tgt [Gaiellales bacterium]|nr:tRNA guanosine(34) transglycosylase Tgt [Gaiellales bacterium]
MPDPLTGRFDLIAEAGEARAGVLQTAHGELRTPVFMPVGTKASVKAVLPAELEALGVQILLGNSYHLHFRPGAELIERMGGLHRFMQWPGPLLTDSGGFQVFSLRHTATRTDDEGVVFRSVYDGSEHRFSPELAMDIQRRLGSDIAMAFDECPPADATRPELAEAVRRTSLWAERSREQARADGQLVFGIVQGGTDPALRTESARAVTGMDFDGYAIGGLSVGEERLPMLDTVTHTTALLPPGKPRYFMGLGDPEGMVEMIARGVDMFDCVLPTRLGRTGSAMTATGRLNLRNARFAEDPRPLVEGCACPACSGGFSRAYIRHLIGQREIAGLRLLTLHNLHQAIATVDAARRAIVDGSFASWREERALEARIAGS